MSRHEAVLKRHSDGTVTVEHADPVIYVAKELLERAASWVLPGEGIERLQLDTAGEYLYPFVGWRPSPAPEEQAIYERITA